MSLPLHEVDLAARVRAAFTTTGRGAAAFNLSRTVGDEGSAVDERRERLASWLGAPVAYAHQVHGREVLVCTGVPDPAAEVVGVADALVTSRHDVGLAVLVADCVPVLLADPHARVVATVHAGRRGLVEGVVPAALAAMRRRGADLVRTYAVVGPAACGRCYEVPAAMRDEVEDVVPGTAATTSWGTPSLDLTAGVLAQLTSAGVRVGRVGGCTIEDPRWFSHRASGDGRGGRPAGRLAGLVRLLPPG